MSCPHIQTLQVQIQNLYKYFMGHEIQFLKKPGFSDSSEGAPVLADITCSSLQGHLPYDRQAGEMLAGTSLRILVPPLSLKQVKYLFAQKHWRLLLLFLLSPSDKAALQDLGFYQVGILFVLVQSPQGKSLQGWGVANQPCSNSASQWPFKVWA